MFLRRIKRNKNKFTFFHVRLNEIDDWSSRPGIGKHLLNLFTHKM